MRTHAAALGTREKVIYGVIWDPLAGIYMSAASMLIRRRARNPWCPVIADDAQIVAY